ncbi:hypothetical protein A2W24_04875 [Microgenomates group bacterium RBG_16_45_19]|nr:MAG: hypothetical protein A2W24_04875 [Microgenomates group bacterium RBG_16_45_19]
MRLLFILNEAAPLYKLGGLGDVGSGLSQALLAAGVDIRLCLPYHPQIKVSDRHLVATGEAIFAAEPLTYQVYLTYLPGSAVPIYLIAEARYLAVTSDALDKDVAKAAVFCLCLADFLSRFSAWKPQLLHLHDWHTALLPLLLKHRYDLNLPSLLTIHNHRYFGQAPLSLLHDLNLNPDLCQVLTWDGQDQTLNLLLEGVIHADAVTTVSPTYRQELLQEPGVLFDALRTKVGRFYAVLNGLDYHTWDPQTDPHIDRRYTTATAPVAKSANKQALCRRLGLAVISSTPLIVFIGRLDPQQKGLSLLLQGFQTNRFPPPKAQFILLGTGDPQLERALHQAADRLPTVHLATRYDEALAHQLYAAADIIIIPSSYEPCGLIQLIAQRYGTLPVAHAVGGLIDTIKPPTTGFLYTPNTLDQLLSALDQALSYLHSPSETQFYTALMSLELSWKAATPIYIDLYTATISGDMKG